MTTRLLHGLLWMTATLASARAAEPERTNVLVILTDQFNPAVTSVYGGPVKTPHLERLAARGVVFTQAACTLPVCSPSRASIVTGRYVHAHGIFHNCMRVDYPAVGAPETEQGITNEDVTYDRILAGKGYVTQQVGKWHLSGEKLRYYTEQYGEHIEYAREMAPVFAAVRETPADRWMDWYGWALPVEISPVLRRIVEAEPGLLGASRYREFILEMGRSRLSPGQHFDERVADRAVALIQAAGGRPFSLTCSFNYPHDPNVVRSPYYERFDPAAIELPANAGAVEPYFSKNFSRQAAEGLGEQGVREFLRIYYASVAFIDDQVGRVLDALEQTNQMDRTLVVFTSDHGDMVGGHGMIWKSTMAFYDEIVRVPLIISGSRVKSGRVDAPVSLVDLAPTLLTGAGETVPEEMQGVSLWPELLGQKSVRRYAFCERGPHGPGRTRVPADPERCSHMVQGEGWKYFSYPDGAEFLFDRANDPGETRNLASEPAHTARKEQLQEEIRKWLERTRYR